MAERVLLGLAGWPLKSSLSPVIHRIFMDSVGMEGAYMLYPVEAEGFSGLVDRLAGEGLRGLNVTFPHKQAAASLCSELDAVASETGAVNTLLFGPDGVSGFNTDAPGFGMAVSRLCLGEPFLVAGSGGAARAATLALSRLGRKYRVFCREPYAWRGRGTAERMDLLDEASNGLPAGTLVNATTLGWGDGDPFPVAVASMAGLDMLDLNYNPGWEWRNSLAGTATSVHTGETMLVFQAAESFRIWTGITPDPAAALSAVSRARSE